MTIDPELEAQYNNMARRPDAPVLLEQLARLSAVYRERADASLDCRYGEHARECLDLFRCGQRGAPLYVYIHGGYWQRGDKSIYSYLAATFNAAGIDVALLGYPLCPEVSMTRIVDSIRTALGWLYRNAAALGIERERVNLSGHSAGAHLTAMALTTRWREFGADLPADLIKTAIPISGLYLLEPLLPTTISAALQLCDDETAALSPALLKAAHPAPLLAIVGGAESAEFFRQAERLVEAWTSAEMLIDQYTEPDADHFDVVARLESADSEIFTRIRDWLK